MHIQFTKFTAPFLVGTFLVLVISNHSPAEEIKGPLKIISDSNGFVEVGPKNQHFSHFMTDRSKYFFNKEIRVATGKIGSHNENLLLQTQGATRIHVSKDTGNVGVGTATPIERLHVNGNIRGGSDTKGALRISTSTGWVDIGSKNKNWAHFYTDRDKYYFDKEIRVHAGKIGSHNENLQLQTQGTTRIHVSKDKGNVGIGTTIPAEKLHVTGNGRFAGTVLVMPGGDIPMGEFRNGTKP